MYKLIVCVDRFTIMIRKKLFFSSLTRLFIELINMKKKKYYLLFCRYKFVGYKKVYFIFLIFACFILFFKTFSRLRIFTTCATFLLDFCYHRSLLLAVSTHYVEFYANQFICCLVTTMNDKDGYAKNFNCCFLLKVGQ